MYIIMDLDATLLNDDRRVSNYTLNVLKKLQGLGHLIVINTARSFDATKSIIEEINADYTILNGGTLITKGLDKVYESVVDNETLNKILEEIKKDNIKEYSIQCDEGLFSNLEEYAKTNKRASYFDYSDYFPYNASKILLCSEDGVTPNRLSKVYNLKITHYLNGPWYRLSTSNKHDGNVALYQLLNDTNPKSICFGDDLGDLEMIQNATVGVALKNSIQIVLDNSKIITKYSNDEDGVARYLEQYFNI